MGTRIYIAFFLMFCNVLTAQTYELKKELTEVDKKEIRSLILEQYNNKSLTFSLSTNDLKSEISDFQENIYNKENFLLELNKKYVKDTLNAFYLHQKGEYYDNKKEFSKASNYYAASLKRIDKKDFEDDHAEFYSFRAFLNDKLGKEEAMKADYEKALEMNPLDSIAITFYPMSLFMRGNPQKAKAICENVIEKTDKKLFTAYFTYSFFDLVTQASKVTEEANSGKKHTSYNQSFDFSSIDAYAKKLKNKEAKISETQHFFHFLAIMINYTISIDRSTLKGTLPKVDEKKTKEFKKWLTNLYKEKKLNEYTYHRFLGMIYFLMEEDDKAIIHTKKVLDIIPKEKQTAMMDLNEPYVLLEMIYKRNKAFEAYREIIQAKIEKRKNDINLAEAYNDIGLSYLVENDDWETAKVWIQKALNVEYNNVKSLGLLSYINLLNKREIMKGHYIDTAVRYVTDEKKLQIMVNQIVAYHILKGELENAKTTIESCDNTFPSACEAARKLFNTYLKPVQ